MTSNEPAVAQTITRYRLPEPPEREPDEVTSYRHVHSTGAPLHLKRYLGRPEATLVEADLWIVAQRGSGPLLVPDLLIAFDVDPQLYYEQNGYVVSDQGKPPDFVLEVASRSTAERDTVVKRVEYARLGISEYWRFDHTGEWHGARLAGDRLVEGRYEPIPIVERSAGVLEGQSEAIGLRLRWRDGELEWIDPATDRPIPSFDDEREARLAEERARALEREGRLAAEARVRELERELRRARRSQ